LNIRLKPLALAVTGAVSVSAFAADTTDPGTIVVTATRIATRVSETLSDVTTLTREQIEQAGDLTLPELLAAQPGVQLSSNGGPGASTTLFLRGTNSSHTLILVDGQRLASATTGTTAIEHIPLDQVERIEILRGPASSLYGADALGGVIQIFTRRGSGAPAPVLSVGAGRYGTTTATFAYGGAAGDTRFHVQAGVERSGGFSDIKVAKGGLYDMYNPDRDGYANDNFSASLTQRLAAGFTVGGDYLHSRGS